MAILVYVKVTATLKHMAEYKQYEPSLICFP